MARAEAGDRRPHGSGRVALLRAAVLTVGEAGAGQASLRSIAARAGVDNTLITHYFGSRDALLAAACEWSLDEQLRVADVAVSIILDPAGRDALVAGVAIDPIVPVFQYEMILAGRRNPTINAVVSRHYAACIDRLRRSMAQRGLADDEPLARALFALVDGLVLQQATRVASEEETLLALARIAEILRAAFPASREGAGNAGPR